jgi:hypothetical protein
MESTKTVDTVFLGWNSMPLEATASWLVENIGPDMSKVILALPGARSGRLLEDRLVKACGTELRPARIVTAGALSDALLDQEGTPAARLARTLAWSKALQGLEAHHIQRIVARPPSPGDFSGWWRLAEEVRSLFGELAAEAKDFTDVAEDETLLDQGVSREGERQRWQALALAQTSMEKVLEEADLCDPHLGRLRAINEESSSKVERVVLIGVVEANGLLRRAMELTSAECSALVFAPVELKHTFDDLGCLIASEWSQRDTSIELDQWKVADRPADQAQLVRDTLATWGDKFSADEITIGLGNIEVGPFVNRRLSQENIYARDAAGRSLSHSAPAKLLAQVARFIESSRFLDFAELMRNVDFEDAVRAQLKKSGKPELDPIATLDAYFNQHYPNIVDGVWLANKKDEYDLRLRAKMESVWNACEGTLDGLRQEQDMEIQGAVAHLRRFLERIYKETSFDLNVSAERESFAALEAVGKGLTEIDELPASIAPKCNLAQVLQLLIRGLSSGHLSPDASAEGQDTIEMLGWLELPLDNAEALIVVGFEDGHVPESVRGDAYLPNTLRHSLELLDDDKRMARDLYASELLVHSRKQICFITGRRSQVGDPLLPSRIVFHCPEDQVAPRVQRFLKGTPNAAPRVRTDTSRFVPPGDPGSFKLEKISVTDFRTYLRSPYMYFLNKVAKIETLDDRSRELDGRSFGNLAHAVVERFGKNKQIRDKVEAAPIAKYLKGQLHDLSQELFGACPLPAIRLQIDQLERRLMEFANKQAERRYQGWEIQEVEWSPEGCSVDLDVDGETVQLRGRIDRIDYHPTKKAWAIWDYKAGNNISQPAAAHLKRDGTWRDLQLPLYCWLVQELLGDDQPEELGYISLCQDLDGIGFKSLAPPKQFESMENLLTEAHDTAKDVIRKIRRGEFFNMDGFEPFQDDLITRAIGGLGLVEENEEETEEAAQ